MFGIASISLAVIFCLFGKIHFSEAKAPFIVGVCGENTGIPCTSGKLVWKRGSPKPPMTCLGESRWTCKGSGGGADASCSYKSTYVPTGKHVESGVCYENFKACNSDSIKKGNQFWGSSGWSPCTPDTQDPDKACRTGYRLISSIRQCVK